MKTAFVLITSDIGAEDQIVQNLKRLSEIKEAKRVMGYYDIVAKIEGSNKDAIREIITGKIRTIDNIRTTLSLFPSPMES